LYSFNIEDGTDCLSGKIKTELQLKSTYVPGDVIKLLVEGGVKVMTILINTIPGSGEWRKGFKEVTMAPLKKKLQATKCSDHSTISLGVCVSVHRDNICSYAIPTGCTYVLFLS
jgi:hypothetical protein